MANYQDEKHIFRMDLNPIMIFSCHLGQLIRFTD